MDNTINDWLYIIVIIAVTAFSWIRKNLARKQMNDPTNDENDDDDQDTTLDPDDWKDIYGPVPQPVSIPVTQHSSTTKKVAHTLPNEGVSTVSKPVQITTVNTPNVAQTLNININDADKLKAAVVYAEIINRKY